MTAKAPMLAIAACVLLAAGFYFLAYKPADEEQTELESETADLESQASSLRNEIAALTEIKNNEVEIRSALSTLEEYVPEGPAQSSVVRQLQQAADDAGVTIESMQFGEPERVEDAPESGEPGMVLARITSSVQLDGGYFQIVDFLRRIEVDVPRAVLMTQLSLGEGEDGLPQLTGSWAGDLFALVPVAETVEPGEGDADAEADGEGGDPEDGDDDAEGAPDADDDELEEAAG